MTILIGISGSLRSGSFNSGLLRAAVEAVPDGVALEIGSIKGIPAYDGDVETADGLPPAVTTLKEQIVAADGLLIVTPEYNNSIPGVLKNTIDWLSRPVDDIPRVFGGRPVALMGASVGPAGTALSQVAWLPVLRFLGARPWFGQRMMVGGAGGAFDASGELTDDAVRERLGQFIAGFAEFVAG